MNFFDDDQSTSKLQIWVILMFLAFYSIMSAYLEHKTLPLHRSAVATLIGIAIGVVLNYSFKKQYTILIHSAEALIFLVLYPPMAFVEGYNFKRGAFIKNLKYSIVFGIAGTFVFYAVTAGLLYLASQLDLLRDAKDINNIRNLSIWEVLLVSACMCGMDAIAGIEAAQHQKYPKLHAIIKGQGIFKDCVTVVLFRTIMSLQKSQADKQLIFYWYTPFKIIGNFLILVIGSVFLGIVFGSLITFIFKKWRFLSHDKGITQTSLVFVLGFALYILSQMVSLSGVVSILSLGFILNRYNLYNLSEQGRLSSSINFNFVSRISEGLLFLLMGSMIWETDWQSETTSQISHSWSFIMITIAIVFFSRFVNIYVCALLSRLISNTFIVTKKQLFAIFMVGLPKGATTFALFSSVSLYNSHSQYAHKQGLVIKSTIIMIVIISCVIINSVMGLIVKKSIKGINNEQIKQYLLDGADEEQINRNKLDRIEEKIEKRVNKAKSRFRVFEDERIKPWLIYRFLERRQQILDEKIQQMRKKQQKMFEAIQQNIIQKKQNNSSDQLHSIQ